MKRSGPPARRTPLARGGPLARDARLRPVNPERKAETHAEDFGPQADLCRELDCFGCGMPAPCEPAHHPTRKAGGVDGDCCPLCPGCHRRQHAVGVITWQAEAGSDLQLGAAVLRAILAAEHVGPRSWLISRANAALGALRGVGVDPRLGGNAPAHRPRR